MSRLMSSRSLRFGRSKSSKSNNNDNNNDNSEDDDGDAVFLEAVAGATGRSNKDVMDASETSATTAASWGVSNNSTTCAEGDATHIFKKKRSKNGDTTPSAVAADDDEDNDEEEDDNYGDSVLTVKTSNQKANNKKKSSSSSSNSDNDNNNSIRRSSTANSNSNTRQSTSGGGSSSNSANNPALNNIPQWHHRWVTTERERRRHRGEQWRSARDRLRAWQQLLRDSTRETAAAARWVTGLALARGQLLAALELGSHRDGGGWADDSESDSESEGSLDPNAKSGNNIDDELPEKLKEESDTVVDTNAAVNPFEVDERSDDDDDDDNNQSADRPASPLRRHKSGSNSHNAINPNKPQPPPVAALTIPNRAAYARAPVLILFKQHNMLHQNLLTALDEQQAAATDGDSAKRKSKPPMAVRVQQLAQQLQACATALEREAAAIVQELQDAEHRVEGAWESYFTMAEEMLEAEQELPGAMNGGGSSSDDSEGGAPNNNTKKHSVGDVWLAEMAYRSAVQRQNTAWADRGPQLETLLNEAHTAERQRRLKLRHILTTGVLHKHAAAFERVQQVHTEALESYFEHTTVDEVEGGEDLDLSARFKSNDSLSTKRTQNSKAKGGKMSSGKGRNPRSYSARERIERMAKKAGATPVFDDLMEEETKHHQPEEDDNSVNVVDVDSVDPSEVGDLKESDLPLLKDAARKAASETLSPVEAKKKKKRDKFSKIKSGVILDRASNKNAMFLDRILYSGSLLESHYIHMAVVAGIEEDAISPVIDDSLRKIESKPLLVVVTSDRTIHMFEIPRTLDDEDDSVKLQHRAIVPGSSPDDALLFLLRRQAAHDVEENHEKEKVLSALEEDAQAARPKFIMTRSKTTAELEETAAANKLHFHNMRPSVSFSVEDYSIRAINRGDNCIKITIKDRDHYDPVQGKSFSKLNFASSSELRAFLLAAELQQGKQAAI